MHYSYHVIYQASSLPQQSIAELSLTAAVGCELLQEDYSQCCAVLVAQLPACRHKSGACIYRSLICYLAFQLTAFLYIFALYMKRRKCSCLTLLQAPKKARAEYGA